MKKIIKILFCIVASLPVLVIFFPSIYSPLGGVSYKLLLLVMFMRPLKDIFNNKFFTKLVLLRKYFAILIGTTAIGHSVGYFLDTGLPLSTMFNLNLWYFDSYLAWGIIALFLCIPLLVTSNNFSMKKLGKKWKKLQYLAYLMFFAVILHVGFVSDEYFIQSIVVLGVYIFVYFLAFYLNRERLKKSTSVKYICVPCSWIYNEEFGDPDSGIVPGTKFEDIPDDWFCPVCGVGKKDFEKITGKIKKY